MQIVHKIAFKKERHKGSKISGALAFLLTAIMSTLSLVNYRSLKQNYNLAYGGTYLANGNRLTRKKFIRELLTNCKRGEVHNHTLLIPTYHSPH